MKLEDGHILAPEQAISAECNVCGESLNFKQDREGSPMAGSFVAEHCGKLYSYGVKSVAVSVKNIPEEMKSEEQKNFEKKREEVKAKKAKETGMAISDEDVEEEVAKFRPKDSKKAEEPKAEEKETIKKPAPVEGKKASK
jgi:hypothetical protein